MLRNGFCAFCRTYSRLGSLHNARAFKCRYLNYFASKLTGKLVNVDFIAVFLNDIHHVDCNYYRNTEFGKLGGKIQVSF